MKYKKLFTEDGIYNEDGLTFKKEFEKIIVPFFEKYMLLDFDCNDMECITIRGILFPITTLMMKRMHGLDPFSKEKSDEQKED